MTEKTIKAAIQTKYPDIKTDYLNRIIEFVRKVYRLGNKATEL